MSRKIFLTNKWKRCSINSKQNIYIYYEYKEGDGQYGKPLFLMESVQHSSVLLFVLSCYEKKTDLLTVTLLKWGHSNPEKGRAVNCRPAFFYPI